MAKPPPAEDPSKQRRYAGAAGRPKLQLNPSESSRSPKKVSEKSNLAVRTRSSRARSPDISTTPSQTPIDAKEAVKNGRQGSEHKDRAFEPSEAQPRSSSRSGSPADDLSILTVASHGDIVVQINYREDQASGQLLARVNTEMLRKASRYFDTMLGSDTFAEGREVREGLAALKDIHSQDAPISSTAVSLLPRIVLYDVQHLPSGYEGRTFIRDFLSLLHGQSLSAPRLTISYFCYLLDLAEGYDCMSAVSKYLTDRKLLSKTVDVLRHKRTSAAQQTEERTRQKMLLGWLTDFGGWFTTCSHRLIVGPQDGRYPTAHGTDKSSEPEIWWRLPDALEVELRTRRACIVETINSLQVYFVALYSSRGRQCKLGYDSSAACDSFQLGELVRFFYTRIGILRIGGSIAERDSLQGSPSSSRNADPLEGDLEQLLVRLREFPSYQIDRDHSHCGMRAGLIPRLEYIQARVKTEVGICRACWEDDRREYRWSMMAKPGWEWKFETATSREGTGRGLTEERACKAVHRAAKDLFTAGRRDWSLAS